MHIKLENFRCHTNSEYTFKDNGLTLLSGQSGQGKTTILNGIIYALYGNIKKPYAHGKTSCKVELEIQSPRGLLHITRKKPKRVIVVYDDKEYEDEEAQGVINSCMGITSDAFIASSFIVQRGDSSVLSMTPSEQVEFIETISLSDNKHETYKLKIKDKLIELQKEKSKNDGEIALLNKYIDMKNKQIQDMNLENIDMKKFKKMNLEKLKVIETELTRDIEELNKNLTLNTQKCHEIKTNSEKYRELQNKIIKVETEKNQLIEQLPVLCSDSEYESMKNECQSLSDSIENQTNYESYTKENARYVEMFNEYMTELQNRFDELKYYTPEVIESLQKECSELETIHSVYEIQHNKLNEHENKKKYLMKKYEKVKDTLTKLCKPSKKYPKMIESLNKKIQKLEECIQESEENIEIYKTKQTLQKVYTKKYECPTCNTSLSIEHDKLVCIVTEEDTTDYKGLINEERENIVNMNSQKIDYASYIQLLQDITEIESIDIQVPEFNKNRYDELHSLLSTCASTNKEYLDLKNRIDNTILPQTLIKVQKTVSELKNLVPKNYKSKDIETLKFNLLKCKDSINEYNRLKNIYTQIQQKVTNVDKKLEELKVLSYGITETDIDNITKIEKKIMEASKDITKKTKELAENRDMISTCLLYVKYSEYTKDRDSMIVDIDKYKSESDTLQKNIHGYMRLNELIKLAQVMSIEKILDSLNLSAKAYLDNMFEEPISIKLENTKNVKGDTKNQMNTQIVYKGNIYDNIDQLSGGERQRCNLAYLLALNDMLGSKILLLDECLNNLDHEINSEILNYLRELGNDKMIIVVSHEAVEGIFDDTVVV